MEGSLLLFPLLRESKVVNLTVDRKQVLKNELYAKDNYVTDTRIQ